MSLFPHIVVNQLSVPNAVCHHILLDLFVEQIWFVCVCVSICAFSMGDKHVHIK